MPEQEAPAHVPERGVDSGMDGKVVVRIPVRRRGVLEILALQAAQDFERAANALRAHTLMTIEEWERTRRAIESLGPASQEQP